MPRRILKSRIPRSRDKYSVEQTGLSFALPTTDPVNGLYQQGVLIVPSVSTQGMRKVKHLTVNLAVNGATDIFWALVFVPEGTILTLCSQLVLSMAVPCMNLIST